MDPTDERRIERLVRRPEAMAEEERMRAKQLVEEDPGAALYASFLRGFYDRLKEEREADKERRTGEERRADEEPLADEERSGPSRIESFVQRLFEEEGSPRESRPGEGSPEEDSKIPVEPFDPPRSARPTVLAAETISPQQKKPTAERRSKERSRGRFSVLATFASEGGEVFVRVVGDWKREIGRLYVFSGQPGPPDQPGETSRFAVSFPELGTDLLTNREGRATFDLPEADIDGELRSKQYRNEWAGTSAVVRRPIASDELMPSSKTVLTSRSTAGQERPRSRVLCRREEGTLVATVHGEGESAPAFLSVEETAEDSSALLSLRSGGPAKHELSSEGTVVLRLYE